MTTGEKLKKTIGISHLPDVFITRVILPTNRKINIIYYDSRRKRLSKQKCQNLPYQAMVYSGAKLNSNEYDQPLHTPLISLESWNGDPRSYLFIMIDLAFQHLLQSKNFERLPESNQKFVNLNAVKYYLPEITLADLKDKGNIAPSTMTWRKDRNKIMGSENTTLKILDVFLNEADDSVTFAFQTKATKYKKDDKLIHDPSVYNNPKKRVTPLKLNLINNPEKKYEIQLKVLKFFSWLDTHPVDQAFKVKDLKEILKVADIQVFNTSPSFQYQSYNYNCSQIDASAYPTKIAPKVWDKRLGGDYFLDKHLFGFLQQISFFLNPMASSLSQKLKDRGII